MSLREILNLWAYVMLLLALIAVSMVVEDLAKHQPIDYLEAVFLAVSVSPSILMIITGQAYGLTFFTNLIWSHTGSGRNHYSLERSLAREGKGREAAQAMLWRDRLVGDVAGLIAILEMARLDPRMQPEAMRATHRLLANPFLPKHERDHVGRLLSLLKISDSAQFQRDYKYK
jgi:hypothetical protein